MAWAAIAVGVGTAAAGYFGAKESNKAGKGAGNVDIRSSQEPWDPSKIYRQWLMDQAAQYAGMPAGYAIPGQTYRPGGDVGAPWSPGGGQKLLQGGLEQHPGTRSPGAAAAPPAAAGATEMVQRPDGRWVPATPQAKRGKGGGGGAPTPKTGGPLTPPAPKFEGTSPETDAIRRGLMDRAAGGDPLYPLADQFTGRVLSGDPAQDPNFYRTETADMLRGVGDDPDLRRYIDQLFAGQMPGSAAAASPEAGPRDPRLTGGTRNVSFRPQAAERAAAQAQQGYGGDGAGPVGVVDDLQAILGGKYLDQENPQLQALIDRSTRTANEELDKRLKANALRAAGSGMYGATPWAGIESESLADFGAQVAESEGIIRFQDREARLADLMQALGLGAAYDTSALDRAAQERIAASNASAAGAGAAASADAARYAVDQERASRAELARMEALGGAIGMGGDLRKFGASGMGGLASMLSSDQQFGLGMTPELTGTDIRDWMAAGDLSLGSDANRNAWQAARGQEGVARSGINASRSIDQQRLDFAKQQWSDPLSVFSRFGDVLGQASGGYGSTRDFGYDKRSQSPSYTNPYGAAVAGFAGGWSAGKDMFPASSGGTTVNMGGTPQGNAGLNPSWWR